ncbi:hypothetical protein GCM10008909_07160 [Hathewaya limosa]|uniref:Uncharacterized protein involved in cysteine biosynthesis n=1 Tax=Hathewaya limosa TaxID=1536 RepID=A0ABU0JQ10_HATLI|nr:uncharacterized protein involved in cysteine biosynthesis [Hathewaya limosa]
MIKFYIKLKILLLKKCINFFLKFMPTNSVVVLYISRKLDTYIVEYQNYIFSNFKNNNFPRETFIKIYS